VALDEFSRVVGAGWGSADQGGAWSVIEGSSNSFIVNGAAGQIETPARGERSIVLASSTSVLDVDALVTIRRPTSATGPAKPGVYAVLRWSQKSEYRVGVHINPGGTVTLRASTSRGDHLFWDVSTGLSIGPGEILFLRAQAKGSSPTTVRARVWLQGAQEPKGWQASANDATVGLQTKGRIGIATAVDGNRESTILIERLEVRLA
jgi:hypothetical protein